MDPSIKSIKKVTTLLFPSPSRHSMRKIQNNSLTLLEFKRCLRPALLLLNFWNYWGGVTLKFSKYDVCFKEYKCLKFNLLNFHSKFFKVLNICCMICQWIKLKVQYSKIDLRIIWQFMNCDSSIYKLLNVTQ